MTISTFTFNDVDINVTLLKNTLEFTFVKDGKKYGQKVKINGRTKMDVVNATANIIICAIQSIQHEGNTRLPEGDTGTR